MPDKNSNRPDLIAYAVTEGKDDKKFYLKLGAAWKNKAGGFGVRLHANPIDGEILLLPPSEPAEPEGP